MDYSIFNTYYYNNNTNIWTSIENTNVQIREINSNYFMGIVNNGVYNIYYMLYNGYNQSLNSEIVYYNNRSSYKTKFALSLITPPHRTCFSVDPPDPEIIHISSHNGGYPISTGLATLRFWRCIWSTCGPLNEVDTTVTNQTITISCASGSISVNNETLSAGSSKIYNNIPLANDGIKYPLAGTDAVKSAAGRDSLIFIQGLTENAAFSGSVVLDYNSPTTTHDLYGQITVSSTGYNRSIPLGAWISNGYYLGMGNPDSVTIGIN
jgi:hypothetical protein